MDPATSPATSSFLDLNLVPFTFVTPKTEPKLEPVDEVSFHVQHKPYIHSALLSPEVHTPLQQLSPSSDADALFSEYYRLAHQYITSYLPNNPASGSEIVVAAKKRKVRSSDMVRVSSLSESDQIYFRNLVRRTRITFDSLRSLMTGEGRRERPDLKAAALMTGKDLWLNRDRRIIGEIPGIHVGDVFYFRMELCVIGLHGQVQAGIDYVSAVRSPGGEPVATSVIVSGGYEDDFDGGDVIVYTGSGGRDNNHVHQSVAQKLTGGNLALERSMNYGIEVRVIRGIRCELSPTSKIYVYDGLYKVVDFWMEDGKSGFAVYKYKLLRIEGQQEMGSSILKLAEDLKVNPLTVRPKGYLSLDISMGKESAAISLFNDVDDDRQPLMFDYVARPAYTGMVLDGELWGNNAKTGCFCYSECSAGCYCAGLNGGEFAYSENGLLVKGKPLVYECGPCCSCPPSCSNRVTQKGIQNRLEIFRTKEKGWAVRPLDPILAGGFVCEFSGSVVTKQQSELFSTSCDSLVFPNRFPARWVEWGDISDVFPEYMPSSYPSLPEADFSIDVSRSRNVGCYLSHSSSPNVFLQFVLFDHHDASYPHLMVFALENIPPLRELRIDYGIQDESIGKLTM